LADGSTFSLSFYDSICKVLVQNEIRADKPYLRARFSISLQFFSSNCPSPFFVISKKTCQALRLLYERKNSNKQPTTKR